MGEGIRHSLLLETDPEGRFSHLELSTAAGLLTLHPEPDGTLHGHAVVEDGIRHVVGLPWEAAGVVVLEDSVVCVLAVARLLGGALVADLSVEQHGVWIAPTLAVEINPVRVGRAGDTWRLGSNGPVEIDARGVPRLTAGAVWALDDVEDVTVARERDADPRG